MAYCCCTCRALKDSAPSAFGKVSYVHISNGNFIIALENQQLALRECQYDAEASPTHIIEKRGESRLWTFMVEQLTVEPSGDSDTLRRQLSYNKNYMKSFQSVQLGHIIEPIFVVCYTTKIFSSLMMVT
uniref:Ricin B-type lectin domain-containing protein n=1 Tax=Heterorhabditis bacteriophora TaxID=37862 RepID=A0A1I7WUS6_HETBA